MHDMVSTLPGFLLTLSLLLLRQLLKNICTQTLPPDMIHLLWVGLGPVHLSVIMLPPAEVKGEERSND